ncbi:MAG: alpha/beta hydrolase [Chitinophagaceae bacterium]
MDNGYYRLEILTPNLPTKIAFGKFSTILELADNTWKFRTDATTNANFMEFENASFLTIPKREELLNPDFYDKLLGDYVTDDKQIIVIGRSQIRLFAYFENTQKYHGLKKINATIWTAGNTIISDRVEQKFVFTTTGLEIFQGDKLVIKATKEEFYKTEKVSYSNNVGVKLGATIFKPKNPNAKAIVLVHGSGPQDRNGYASIIRLLADIFTREGITVLTYDKQGVGSSSGNWEKENFKDLGQDALAGISYLKNRKDLKLTKIGLGGSSQAGWVMAKAIEQSNDVDFVLAIGAAGSGIPVTEQNIYNTKVQMECSRTFTQKQIDNALTQQRYFFEYVKNQKNAKELDQFTFSLSTDSLLRDWLFPMSKDIDLNNRNQWFTALEIAFNPLDIWKNYSKPVLMTFSEFDDSTPTTIVKANLEKLNKKNIQILVLPNAQHLGLNTNSVCKGDVSILQSFHKDFFLTLKKWIKGI